MKRILLTTVCVLAGTSSLTFLGAIPALRISSGAFLYAQSGPTFLYAQSFRQTSAHVAEESFEARLDPQNPTYSERIKDSHGTDRYVFTIFPQGPEGDTKITSWQAKLKDLHHPMYPNILLASQEPSSNPGNNLGWLDPRSLAAIPIRVKRVIQVDSFFVTLEVKAYHFTPIDSPYLDSMVVQVKFSNTDPRPSNP